MADVPMTSRKQPSRAEDADGESPVLKARPKRTTDLATLRKRIMARTEKVRAYLADN